MYEELKIKSNMGKRILSGGKTHTTISMNVEHYEFCKKEGYSPSRLLRAKINEVMKGEDPIEKNVMELNGTINNKQRLIDKFKEFVNFKPKRQKDWEDFTEK